MISKEQLATITEGLAAASMVGFGWALGGTVGAGVMAGIGINLGSDIIQKGSRLLKEKWISAQHGVLNHDIQRALGRALVNALTSLETRYFELPEANAEPSEKKEAIRKLFRELRDEASTLFVASAEKIVSVVEVKEYLYGEPREANSKLWDRMEGTKLLYSYYGEHFKGFIKDNLSDEVVFWFGEDLKTDKRECNRAWRAFQRLLLEGIQDEVQALRANHEMVRRDLLVLAEIRQKLDELKDIIDRRVIDEPFQRGLEQSLHHMKAMLGKILGTSHRLESKVDVLVSRTARSESKLDAVIAALLSAPLVLAPDKKATGRRNRQFILSSDKKYNLSGQVISQMEGRFGLVDLKELTSELATFEDEAQRIATRSLFSYLASRFRSFESMGHSFNLGSKRTKFILEVGPKIGSTILEVFFFEESQPQTYSEVHIPLSGWGLYTHIHLSVPQELYPHTNALAEVLRVVYLSAYCWLAETLLLRLDDLESKASVALYSSLRTAFRIGGNEQLSESIRFGVVADGRIFYLVDRQTSVSLGTVLSKRKFWSNSSPALSLLNLLGFPLDYQESFSRHAVTQQAQLDFTLTEANYISENPEYLRAEREMVSGNKISVFVISTATEIKLVANFPRSKKGNIIPVLKAHKDHLAGIFERNLDQIIRSTEVLMAKFKAVNWVSAGGVAGSFRRRPTKKREQ